MMLYVAMAFLAGASVPAAPEALQRFEFAREIMTAPSQVVLYGGDGAIARRAAEAAYARMDAIEAVMNDYDPTSELSRLSASAGGDFVVVSEDLWRVLSRAREICVATGGAFDVTAGPCVDLWRRARQTKTMPSAEELAAARSVCGYRLMTLDDARRAVRLEKRGMRLDLGGIAKGYAVHEGLAVLEKLGVKSALVSIGGEVAAGDAPPGARGWRVGVAPVRDGAPSLYVWLSHAVASTSGDAFRFVEIDGKRYSHIVDLRTGLGLTDRSCVTVIAPEGLLADALATAVSVMGPERGIPFLDAGEGLAGRIVRPGAAGEELFESARWKQLSVFLPDAPAVPARTGSYYRGEGDTEYLTLLGTARRLFAPDPEFQNLPMLYTPAWNGFVEGPTWGAWWIQNSYGTTYCALPFYTEPMVTFLQNAQDLWFDHMGDGKKRWKWNNVDHGVVPDGQLCDAATPTEAIHKQGDGRVDIHDWGMEFTAAGVVMQAEFLLISRDMTAIAKHVPLLERCANFIETRRDPANDLFLAGPAGNLLAPSYAGWKKPDGTYGMAYLAGLSITYIAALDRLIELEKLAGRTAEVARYEARREAARKGLARITAPEGYFVRSVDPDGTVHGLFGAPTHGYLETSPNHDAICFRVADDAQARRILAKIASIPGLRPHGVIIPNYPSLDDMYTEPAGLWGFGTWVNGGHWSTCEGRMVMAYYRLGDFQSARKSMEHMLGFARRFRMDNPLVAFGSEVYQPGEPVNLCYDNFAPPAAFMRGLFEYLYRADGLTLVPHIPATITALEQRFPVRFGSKKLYLSTAGSGAVTGVRVNGQEWKRFDATSVTLPYESLPENAAVQILLGGAAPREVAPCTDRRALPPAPTAAEAAAVRAWFKVITTNEIPLRIGADSHAGSRFLGDIDRACVFGRALSAEEIAAMAGGKDFRGDAAMVADYTFEHGEGGVFPNEAGTGLAAKTVGEVEVVDAPGGKAVRLGGKGYLEVARDPKLDLTEACTLCAWIRPAQMPQGGGRIIDKTIVGTSNGYLLDTYPGNGLRVIVEADSIQRDAALAPGAWVHVAATVAPAGKLALYIGGKEVMARAKETIEAWDDVTAKVARLRDFHARLQAANLGESYEAAHARLAIEYLAVTCERAALQAKGALPALPPRSQYAADRSYLQTTLKLCAGLEKTIEAYSGAGDARRQRVLALWMESAGR